MPIYRGAPNVADFAPAPNCYIDADDFDGPADLARFLRSLTDDQYLAYHEWRATGPSDEWRARFGRFNTSAFARLAQPAAVMRIGLLADAAR